MATRRRFDLNTNNPMNIIIGLVLMFLLILGFFYITRLALTILYYLSPIFLILTLIIDYKVVTGYGKWLIQLTRRNTVLGVLGIVLSVIGFPVVSAFLFGKALLNRRIKQVRQEVEERQEGKYIEYEELDSKPTIDLDELKKKLPEEQQKKQPEEPRRDNNYDQLFD